jgi:hypothetical protein
MRKLIIILLGTVLLVSCRKEKIVNDTSAPLFIKVDAVHSDGQVISSDIIYLK